MKNIIVIGSGVMGLGIAEQISNANFNVHLLDIVPKNTQDRNILAKQAISKSTSLNPHNLIPGNLEDDIELFKSADWVIEVIIENLSIKKDLYQKLDQYCPTDCIISSNTSTIPLEKLIEDRSINFKEHFLITHFFNPPRYMPLLELVVSQFTQLNVIQKISQFIDINLGKTIVKSNDTPGFIANRIGCYWLEAALSSAIEMNLPVEEIDNLFSKPLGMPKTGIFGLYDLIGIDVMQLIIKSLSSNLNKNDDFLNVSKTHDIISKMVNDGLIGRKGKGGFYRIIKDDNGNKIKQAINLNTGIYKDAIELNTPAASASELFNNNEYVSKVLSKTLSYTCSLIPEVTTNLSDIDQAMKLGYNWKFGPFELIDMIGVDNFIGKLKFYNIKVPDFLNKSQGKVFYKGNTYFDGIDYTKIQRPESIIYLKDFKNNPPICYNESAKIWDIGDEIATIEFTSKMAIANNNVFQLIIDFFDKYSVNFKSIIIANEQDNFSVGANLKFILDNIGDLKLMDEYLKLGQKAMMLLKYSKLNVISALKGKALGGGSEILLHSSAISAHIETNSGLVESSVGLIPGWGGCKEMILRSSTAEDLIESFKNIILGKISSSAYELQKMLKLDQLEIVMNSNRVFQESKILALKNLPKNTHNPKHNIDVEWEQVIYDMNLIGYDKIIAYELASLFANNQITENELLNKEREIFIKLLSNKLTQDRISHMLKFGKKLKN